VRGCGRIACNALDACQVCPIQLNHNQYQARVNEIVKELFRIAESTETVPMGQGGIPNYAIIKQHVALTQEAVKLTERMLGDDVPA
jgi:hypothetical protein